LSACRCADAGTSLLGQLIVQILQRRGVTNIIAIAGPLWVINRVVRPNQELLAACPSCGKPLHLTRTTQAAERSPAFQILECKTCRLMLSQAAPAQTDAAQARSSGSERPAIRQRVMTG